MKHSSIVCNMSDGSRYNDGKGGHCCPLHADAENLLVACQVALSQLTEDREEYIYSDIQQIRHAIAHATGKKMKVLCFLFRGEEYLVDESGRININRTGFSDHWIFRGGSPHHWHEHVVVTLAQAFENPKLLDGCMGWDIDHGTRRKWCGQYNGRLPRICNAHIIEQ